MSSVNFIHSKLTSAGLLPELDKNATRYPFLVCTSDIVTFDRGVSRANLKAGTEDDITAISATNNDSIVELKGKTARQS
jgi:hypothetical protein